MVAFYIHVIRKIRGACADHRARDFPHHPPVEREWHDDPAGGAECTVGAANGGTRLCDGGRDDHDCGPRTGLAARGPRYEGVSGREYSKGNYTHLGLYRNDIQSSIAVCGSNITSIR